MSTAFARALPGSDFLRSVTTTSWTDISSPAGPLCRLLITPGTPRPGERAEAYLSGMPALAQGMGLAPVGNGSRPTTWNLMLEGGVVALDYGHPKWRLHVPSPTESWYRQAARSRTVHVTAGFDPHPAGSGPEETFAYLAATSRTGRLWSGIAARHHSA